MKRLQANKKKVVLFNKNAAPSELLERERELLQKEKLKKLKAERLAKERAHKKEYDRQYAIFKQQHPSQCSDSEASVSSESIYDQVEVEERVVVENVKIEKQFVREYHVINIDHNEYFTENGVRKTVKKFPYPGEGICIVIRSKNE